MLAAPRGAQRPAPGHPRGHPADAGGRRHRRDGRHRHGRAGGGGVPGRRRDREPRRPAADGRPARHRPALRRHHPPGAPASSGCAGCPACSSRASRARSTPTSSSPATARATGRRPAASRAWSPAPIGREQQLRQLQDAFAAVVSERARRIVTVLGEAGVGKSRLVHDVDTWLARLPSNVWVLRGRASPSTENVPNALLRSVFAERLGIRATDGPERVRAKWREGWAQLLGTDELDDGAPETVATWLGFTVGEEGRRAVAHHSTPSRCGGGGAGWPAAARPARRAGAGRRPAGGPALGRLRQHGLARGPGHGPRGRPAAGARHRAAGPARAAADLGPQRRRAHPARASTRCRDDDAREPGRRDPAARRRRAAVPGRPRGPHRRRQPVLRRGTGQVARRGGRRRHLRRPLAGGRARPSARCGCRRRSAVCCRLGWTPSRCPSARSSAARRSSAGCSGTRRWPGSPRRSTSRRAARRSRPARRARGRLPAAALDVLGQPRVLLPARAHARRRLRGCAALGAPAAPRGGRPVAGGGRRPQPAPRRARRRRRPPPRGGGAPGGRGPLVPAGRPARGQHLRRRRRAAPARPRPVARPRRASGTCGPMCCWPRRRCSTGMGRREEQRATLDELGAEDALDPGRKAQVRLAEGRWLFFRGEYPAVPPVAEEAAELARRGGPARPGVRRPDAGRPEPGLPERARPGPRAAEPVAGHGQGTRRPQARRRGAPPARRRGHQPWRDRGGHDAARRRPRGAPVQSTTARARPWSSASSARCS